MPYVGKRTAGGSFGSKLPTFHFSFVYPTNGMTVWCHNTHSIPLSYAPNSRRDLRSNEGDPELILRIDVPGLVRRRSVERIGVFEWQERGFDDNLSGEAGHSLGPLLLLWSAAWLARVQHVGGFQYFLES